MRRTFIKFQNLVFAILLANNQLVTLVRMNKFFLHPVDLHIIQNLVDSSESLKTAESWTPICLPKFDANGYMHGHVSYLAEDCQACLLLLTVDRNVFFVLSEAKQVGNVHKKDQENVLTVRSNEILFTENCGETKANELFGSN